jgi:poly(A) polymerase
LQPHIIHTDEHAISRSDITPRARQVVSTLQKAGFNAYLVGGCVRDLLLHKTPKDYDVATSAHPEAIRELFKNSRIIGRRFRLVHIHFGREIIEVATFRGSPANGQHFTTDQLSDQGMILHDNVYGSIEEDALRRDFTINALYYDPETEAIIDYTGGYEDLLDKTLKILGEPQTRYREDPVRMLRAVRFLGKLNFKPNPETIAPIVQKDLHALLGQIAPARLFEEYLKLFLTGQALKTFFLLKEYDLFSRLFPLTLRQEVIDAFPQQEAFLIEVLKSTDRRFEKELAINPAFLIAAFLWYPLQWLHRTSHDGTRRGESWFLAGQLAFKQQNASLSIPKRFSSTIQDIWLLQRLFERNRKKIITRVAEHPKFRAGFDFLILRSRLDAVQKDLLHFWQAYEQATPERRLHLITEFDPEQFKIPS